VGLSGPAVCGAGAWWAGGRAACGFLDAGGLTADGDGEDDIAAPGCLGPL
jgi:hypothetical protein